MPCRIEQHISDRIPDLARRLQRSQVIAVRKQSTAHPNALRIAQTILLLRDIIPRPRAC